MIGFNTEMIISFITIVIAPIVALILVLGLPNYKKWRGKQGKLPPCNVGRPVLGAIFCFFKTHCFTLVISRFLEQLPKHGKIFTIRFIGWAVIISADPELNKFVVYNQTGLFENNAPSQLLPLLGKNNILFMVGKQHKQMKLQLMDFFKSWDLHATFLEDVQNAASRVLNGLRHENIVYASQLTQNFAFSISAEKFIGMDAMDREVQQLLRDFVTLRDGFHAVKINLPKTRYWKALKAKETLHKFMKKRVESKKREHNENTKPTDFIDWHLKNNSHESVEDICSFAIGNIIGSVFQISSAIDLAIYFLANCPKAVQQLREEYQEIMRGKKDGEVKLTWHDYKNMKFSQHVINETLRLGNVTPGILRKAMKDVEFNGYVIPKGTRIVVYTKGMHLDPIAFERPEQFNPWRWENMMNTNNYMPFGGGMHYCSGIEITKIQTVIFLHQFLHRFNWELAGQDDPIYIPTMSFPKELPIKVYPVNGSV
ncbi:hypothetical protein LUZ60_016894 [Juncus effusus]|nr:hypothetical protein LUZ60_016894 [Juncus effusus]